MKTKPDFIDPTVNYYNIDDDPQLAWNYPKVLPKYEIEGMGWSEMEQNFSNRINAMWPRPSTAVNSSIDNRY